MPPAAVEAHTPATLLPPPVADAVPMHTLDTTSCASLRQSPSSSPRTPQRRPQNMNLSVSPARSQGPVVSPRPMLSPKHSFSVDPFTKVTQVEQLERIAAQADTENADMSGPGGSPAGRNKTLPRAPQESRRASPTLVRQKVDTLFPPDVDQAPPTPTLAAVTSLKASRNHLGVNDGLSGLDALEAKLLAQVGTRKVESSERRPDVRSVMPIAIPRPAKADPANDSAISSLTLPGLDAEANPLHAQQALEEPRQLLEPPPDFDDDSDDDRALTERRVSRKSKENVKSSSSTGTHKSKGKSKDKERRSGKRSGGNGAKEEDIHRMRKTAHGRVAAWLGSIEPDEPPQSGTPPPLSPVPVADLSDVVREDAQGRVAAWLGRMQTGGAPRSSRPPSPKLASNDDDASKRDEQKSGSANHVSAPPREAQQVEAEADTPRDVSAAPNPRSSGFMPMGTYKAQKQQRREAADAARALKSSASSRLAVYPPRPQDPEVRYDIRSARGGKGGKVTSVAAIWAQQQDKPETPKPTSPPKDVARLRDIQPVKKAVGKTSPQAMSKPSPRNPFARNTRAGVFTANSDSHSKPTSGDLTARRTRAIKATSVPAVVSSSLATPMLSSTASLARPTPALTDRHKANKLNITRLAEVQTSLPTVKEDAPSAKTPVAKGELAFGQARLRELIKRYQGQAS